MSTAFALNALLTGLLIYGAAAALSQLIRGRAAYLIALFAFFLAVAAPLGMTRPHRGPVSGTPGRPSISLDASTPVFTRVWSAGTILLLLRELRGHIHLARIRGRRLTGEEKAKLGWPRDDDRIELADALPMTLASRVLISAELLNRTPIEVARAIVRHERAHLRWRDPVVGVLVRLILVFFWIAPPLWLLERLIRRERESAADIEALRDVEDRADYAAALVTMARRASARAGVGITSELEHRMRRLFRDPVSPLVRIVFLAAAGVTAAAIAFVPVAGFDGRVVTPPQPSVPIAPLADATMEPVEVAKPRALRPRARTRTPVDLLPTGLRFGEIPDRLVESIPPATKEFESDPVPVVSEVTAPAEPGHADLDRRVEVRRHVIRIRR